ncbi:hypothetical protein GCM10010151_36000 [Actinoallomurus spadix]|uniref:Uncharacterized protein n=1 Tax=Actinoallomurus spadix TaxID=79912 RepID=A0ABN0WQ80_9ACTN
MRPGDTCHTGPTSLTDPTGDPAPPRHGSSYGSRGRRRYEEPPNGPGMTPSWVAMVAMSK